MDYLNILLAPTAWSSGFWPSIIRWFAGVGSIGLGIVLMTLCIKIVLFPLDFFQKRVSRKMSENQAKMKPELDEIQAKYAKNPEMMKYKQQEVYKKYNASKSTSNGCVTMLVYMVLTMVIFFSLFSGLRSISQSQINYEYYTLEQTYIATYNSAKETQTEEEAVLAAQTAVTEKYGEIREGFLTIKNIWRPDSYASVFPTGKDFISGTATFVVYGYKISETDKLNYFCLSTNTQELTDPNDENIKYVEPYVDLNGNIYAVKNLEEGATNPNQITIAGKTYNVVYSTIFSVYENADLGISYYYLTSEKSKTFKIEENTHIMPYVKDDTIFVASITEQTQVEISGKTYNIDTTKTIDDLLGGFDKNKQTQQYGYNAKAMAEAKFIEDYDLITAGIQQEYKGQWNGYLILVLLAGVITFLSSYFANLGLKVKDQDGNIIKGARPKPTMGIVLAVVMILFTISYTSAFAIYIITNSAVSMLFNFLSNLLMNKIEEKKEKKNTVTADYVRK